MLRKYWAKSSKERSKTTIVDSGITPAEENYHQEKKNHLDNY
jgi:hypothetical protein